MDWWQYALLYVGVWIMGFFTGLQAGVGSTLVRLAKSAQPPQGQPGPQDIQQMMAMMGHAPGGRQ